MHQFAAANGNASLPVALPAPQPATSEMLKHMYDTLMHDRARVFDKCHDYMAGRHLLPFAPRDASDQIRDLQARSVTNMIPWLVNLPTQVSMVDGYRRGSALRSRGESDTEDESVRFPPEYDVWQKERMDARQAIIYRAAFTYGHAFVHLNTLVPGEPKIEILPTRNTVAFFDDPVNDIRPAYVLTIKTQPFQDTPGLAVYWDATHRYEVLWTNEGEFTLQPNPAAHGMDGCPVVRYVCTVDDEGCTTGVVEPGIPMQNRVNQSVFSTNITADFGAFKVRTAAGLVPNVKIGADGEPVVDPNGNYVYEPVQVSQARLLLSDDPQTKFGQLDETPLDGYLRNEDQAIKNLAAISQLPIHALMGSVSNLSAEALAALEAQFRRFCEAFWLSAGESHEELFRMIAAALGDTEGATSYGGEVRWRDFTQKAFSAVVDGLAKLVESVGMPHRAAWAMVPGVTSGMLKDWEQLKEEEVNDDLFAEPRDTLTSARERRPAAEPADGA
jgi:hypothetical protein